MFFNNYCFFKTSETFDFTVVRFQAPEMFNFIVFNVALRFFIIALHLKSGVKTKGESSYIFLLVIKKKMANNKNIIFSAAVRGFHVYKASWKPKEDELLECSYEKDNSYDSFSIKVFKLDSPVEIIGHLSMEISQITKFIMDSGAQVAVKLRGRHYRRSPFIQGGLEVPCEIKITMIGSIINHHLLVRYESLLKEPYIERRDEEIIRTFLSIRNEHENVNQEIEIEIEAVQTESLKKTGQKKKAEVKSKDIRDMFQNPHQNSRQNPHHDSRSETQNVTVID